MVQYKNEEFRCPSPPKKIFYFLKTFFCLKRKKNPKIFYAMDQYKNLEFRCSRGYQFYKRGDQNRCVNISFVCRQTRNM